MSGKDNSQEILIIRRGGGDDLAAAKGGAWKIAYADFVTAMMAFFLVMWLINSANEVTRARVASYFNPIKMTDASPARKGLKEEINPQSAAKQSEGHPPTGGTSNEKSEGKPVEGVTVSEDTLLMNPYAMLDELVRQADVTKRSGETAEANTNQGDPFNPRSFEHLSELQAANAEEASPSESKSKGAMPADTGNKLETGAAGQSGSSHTDAESQLKKSDEAHATGVEKKPDATLDTVPAAHAPKADHGTSYPAPAGESQESVDSTKSGVPGGGKLAEKKASPHTEEEYALAQELRQEIEDKIAKFKGKIDLNAKVTLTDEGLLVILEDGHGRSMFSVGSAQPNPALIEIIGDIGKLLGSTEGSIVIRGHTDGRQFRNRKYDNWQLSTDRAHMASYMLIRGGLAEARIKRIEGYGSSSPVVPGDDMADANRRVEFLLSR